MENEYLRMTYTAVATIDPIAREEKTDILEESTRAYNTAGITILPIKRQRMTDILKE
jgi:hypothetical protein